MSETLYERLGGARGIEAVVDHFYDRVLSDPALAPFFAHTSMEKLRTMQLEFFTAATGGPASYSGSTIASAHEGRHIEPKHFARFVEHLLVTLREMGADRDDADEVVGRIALYSGDVIGEVGEDG